MRRLEDLMKIGTRSCVLVALAMTSECGPPAPSWSRLVRQSPNPSKTRQALLIRRGSMTALNNDVYLVVIQPPTAPTDTAALGRVSEESAVLRATRGEALRLEWRSDTELVVACDSCGLEAVDVMQALSHSSGTTVRYHGLPLRDAFDHPIAPSSSGL